MIKKNRILDENLSSSINPILRKIVSTKEGTAGFADVKGYSIGGKTGINTKKFLINQKNLIRLFF